MHYSGFFGGQNQFWPPKIYFIVYTILIFLFFLIGLRKFYRRYFLFFVYIIVGGLYFYSLAFYFKKSGFLWDVQGRHFLPIFFPFYFFVYQGIKNTFSFLNINKIIIFFTVVYLTIFILFLVIPSFYSLKTIVSDLRIVYPGFDFLFLISDFFYFVLAFSILRER